MAAARKTSPRRKTAGPAPERVPSLRAQTVPGRLTRPGVPVCAAGRPLWTETLCTLCVRRGHSACTPSETGTGSPTIDETPVPAPSHQTGSDRPGDVDVADGPEG